MTKYMNENTKSLDAHKQAAIIIICCLKLNIMMFQIVHYLMQKRYALFLR